MQRRQYLGSIATIGAVSALAAMPASAQESGTISDPEGDDYGPGEYTYPLDDLLPEGCFDVTAVDVTTTDAAWEFTFQMATVPNSFGSDKGFSVQVFQLYFYDPNAPDDVPASTESREGVVSTFQEPYHYRRHATGFDEAFEDADGNSVSDDISSSGNTSDNTVTVSVPKAPFETDDVSELKTAMLVFSQDGEGGTGGIRQDLAAEAGDWTIGGVNEDAIDSAPRAMDLVGPEGVIDQQAALSYSAGSPPVVPLTKVEYLISGELPEESLPPTAAATADPASVYGGDSVTLDASGSSDPNGQTLSYQWTQTSGPDADLSNANSAEATVTAPQVEGERTLEFEVEVTNEDDLSATATTSVTVQFKQAPVADAGDSTTVNSGDSVTLDASGSSDPNGQTLSYQWTQTSGPDADLSNANSAEATVTAPQVEGERTLEFEVEVTNEDDLSATATTSVTVQFNEAPVADAGDSTTVSPGFSVTLDASGSSDPDGSELSYEWAQTSGPEVDLDDPTAESPTFTAPEPDSTSTLTFEVTVTDGQGKSATATVDVTVEVENTTTTMPDDDETTTMPDDDGETTTMPDDGSGGDGDGDDTGSGFGPGFGVVGGALGTAGGVAYAAKRLLGEEPAQPGDVTVEDDDVDE